MADLAPHTPDPPDERLIALGTLSPAEATVWQDQGLTVKQRLWVIYYARTLNKAESARKAGYSSETARQTGYENLTKPYIRVALRPLLEERIEISDLLSVLEDQALADLSDLVAAYYTKQPDGSYTFDMKRAAEDGALRNVKRFKVGKDGEVDLEMYNAQAAAARATELHIKMRQMVYEAKKDEKRECKMSISDRIRARRAEQAAGA